MEDWLQSGQNNHSLWKVFTAGGEKGDGVLTTVHFLLAPFQLLATNRRLNVNGYTPFSGSELLYPINVTPAALRTRIARHHRA